MTPGTLSVISKIEILGFDTDEENERLLRSFISELVCLGLTEDVAERTIQIRKTVKIRLPDAIIAATALENNLTLVTRNVADFKSIDGLRTVNPHNI